MRKILSLILLTAISIGFIHCGGGGGDPELTEEQKVVQKLTANNGKWGGNATSTVSVDGLDVTEQLFDGFSISFTENGYTTTGSSPVFPPSDTWAFKPNTNGTILIRNSDSKEMKITSLTDTELVFTLTWDQTTTTAGRQKSIAGEHVFTLKK